MPAVIREIQVHIHNSHPTAQQMAFEVKCCPRVSGWRERSSPDMFVSLPHRTGVNRQHYGPPLCHWYGDDDHPCEDHDVDLKQTDTTEVWVMEESSGLAVAKQRALRSPSPSWWRWPDPRSPRWPRYARSASSDPLLSTFQRQRPEWWWRSEPEALEQKGRSRNQSDKKCQSDDSFFLPNKYHQ